MNDSTRRILRGLIQLVAGGGLARAGAGRGEGVMERMAFYGFSG